MIDQFQGPYRFLSNFWPAVVSLDGTRYPTVEHAYQAAKTLDSDARKWIGCAPTPGSAKRRAKELSPKLFRRDWNDIRIDIMRDLLKQKFSTERLRSLLLATGSEELIEGNPWGDTFWGVCKGKGKNNLGKLLMEIRDEIRREIVDSPPSSL